MRPVCVGCRTEMDIEKNGVMVIGKVHDLMRDGDLYVCPGCGASVITGFGTPYGNDRTFEEEVEYLKKNFTDAEYVILEEE